MSFSLQFPATMLLSSQVARDARKNGYLSRSAGRDRIPLYMYCAPGDSGETMRSRWDSAYLPTHKMAETQMSVSQ